MSVLSRNQTKDQIMATFEKIKKLSKVSLTNLQTLQHENDFERLLQEYYGEIR